MSAGLAADSLFNRDMIFALVAIKEFDYSLRRLIEVNHAGLSRK